MKPIQVSLIKSVCVQYAVELDLKIETLTNETFRASNNDSIIDVPISFLYDQLQNGWEIMETLQNETNYNGED